VPEGGGARVAGRFDRGGKVMRQRLRTYAWLAAGGTSLLLGYILLAAGDIGAAPLLLVAGYCVFIPLHLYRSYRQDAPRSGE
jgi:glucose-6-phosphate-specific signal transduction histidine kinase